METPIKNSCFSAQTGLLGGLRARFSGLIRQSYDRNSLWAQTRRRQHPAIEYLALIGVPNPDRPGSEIVKAHIQLDPKFTYEGSEEDLKADITAFAKENCAPYEVPKIIEITKEIPLTAVGKIDKKVLRK